MLDIKAIEKKTEARLTDYLGILEIRDILQQNPATADKEFAILDDMKVEVGVGDNVKIYKAIKNDEGNWELLEENKKLKTGKINKNNPIKVEAKRVAYDIEWDIDDDEYEDEDDELSLPTEVVIPDDIDDDDIEDYLSDLTGFCHYGYKIKKLKENKKLKKESVSYNDLVRAGTDLWRDGCVVYDTIIDGIYDCTTDGHGGYLVDTTIFPELAKYGDKTNVDNVVGFEEDYEALKILWVFPQLIKSEDFKNKLNLDRVLAYDEDKSFAKEFPTMGGNISMNENKLNEALQVRCKKTYNEDGDEYWSEGNIYTATNLDGQNWSIITNFDNKGKVGPDYMLNDFDEYFEVLQESKNCIKEEKTKLNFIENVDELPNMCYGVLPSDNSIIIIKKGERGYFLTNKDYERAYANIIDWNLRNDKANEICDKLNAELGVTPDQRFTMEIRSMNGNWGNKKAEESKKLQEEITTEEIDCAKTIADIIYKKGIMNWIDVDEMVCDMLKLDCENAKTQDIVNDVYGCLTVYNGLGLNNSTGDFYTQEYAEKHPEVLEESKSIKTESESEYRAVKIIDASEPGVDYGIIMLNKKHSVQDFQKAMWDAYKRNEEQIQEYGDDLSVVLGDIDPTFDWYEIDMDEECLTI